MNFTICKFFILKRCINHTTMNIKTFVFLDSETTGLPFEENNKTRITELCLIAVQSDHLSLGVLPRVQNKINLCFNPRKFISPIASNITGLSNELLEYQPEFDSTSVRVIQDFLNMHRKPVCLVAQNGDKFDYPILKAEIHNTGNQLSDDILCADSLLAFRALLVNHNKPEEVKEAVIPIEFQDELDDVLLEAVEKIENTIGTCSNKLTIEEIQRINETTPAKKNWEFQASIFKKKAADDTIPSSGLKRKKLFKERQSFALGAVYTKLTGKLPINAHRAEADVDMVIECGAQLGQIFVDWCDLNAKKFCDIPMMVPGRSFGK